MEDTISDGNIAVWLGTFKNELDFLEYTKVHYEYDDEIEDIDSQFEKDFDLIYYDRDMVEMEFLKEEKNTLKVLFKGSSYLEEFINSLDDKKQLQYNVIIRIYDYKYLGNKKIIEYKENKLLFYGNVKYKKTVDLSWMGL